MGSHWWSPSIVLLVVMSKQRQGGGVHTGGWDSSEFFGGRLLPRSEIIVRIWWKYFQAVRDGASMSFLKEYRCRNFKQIFFL